MTSLLGRMMMMVIGRSNHPLQLASAVAADVTAYTPMKLEMLGSVLQRLNILYSYIYYLSPIICFVQILCRTTATSGAKKKPTAQHLKSYVMFLMEHHTRDFVSFCLTNKLHWSKSQCNVNDIQHATSGKLHALHATSKFLRVTNTFALEELTDTRIGRTHLFTFCTCMLNMYIMCVCIMWCLFEHNEQNRIKIAK